MGVPYAANEDPPGGWNEDADNDLDVDTALTSPADVESAGRSCMAILVLAAVILLVLCVWIGLSSTGAGP